LVSRGPKRGVRSDEGTLHVCAGTTASGNDSSVGREPEAAVAAEAGGGDGQGGEASKEARAGDGEKAEGSEGEGKGAGGVVAPSSVKDAGVASRHDESPRSGAVAPSDFKAIAAASAADASVFTFGDDDDYDSEEELH
jgi:hypothetical protein